jgi:hypothetical protein
MLNLSRFITNAASQTAQTLAVAGNDCLFTRNRKFKGMIERENVTLPTNTVEDGADTQMGVLFVVEVVALGLVDNPDIFTHLGADYQILTVTPIATGEVVSAVHLLCKLMPK